MLLKRRALLLKVSCSGAKETRPESVLTSLLTSQAVSENHLAMMSLSFFFRKMGIIMATFLFVDLLGMQNGIVHRKKADYTVKHCLYM